MRFTVPLLLSICFSTLGNAATTGSRGDLFSFENVRSLNNADRVRLYNLASKESQHAFWVDKLKSYHEEHKGRLNEDQAAALDDVISFAKSDNGVPPPELKKSMIDAFDFQEVKELVTSLGGDQEQSLGKRNNCSCSVKDDWCGLGDYCHLAGWNCQHQSSGCGWWGQEQCDGDCGNEIEQP